MSEYITTSSTRRTIKYYHTTDCSAVQSMDSKIYRTKEWVDQRDLKKCPKCAGDVDHTNTSRKYYNAALNNE